MDQIGEHDHRDSDQSHSKVSSLRSTCVTWLIHMCDMTHSHVWHDSFTCVTWFIHMCDMTHSHVWHELATEFAEYNDVRTDVGDTCSNANYCLHYTRMSHVNESCHTRDLVLSHIWMSHVFLGHYSNANSCPGSAVATCAPWQKFSKVSTIVLAYSKLRNELTVQKLRHCELLPQIGYHAMCALWQNFSKISTIVLCI